MTVNAIICEYNPFHNGHKYMLNEAKKMTDADYTIAIMSSNFVQRGEPAILDKYIRTRHALMGGADLVVELPNLYSSASAQYFALGATSIANSLGVVDYLCFGSESNNINDLIELNNLLLLENTEIDKYIQMFIKEGKSYPLARQEALKKIYPEKKHLFDILVSPNNILAYEYIRALNILKSDIKPVSIQRIGKDYNDNSLGNIYSSASGIRKNIDDLKEIKKYVPEFVFEDICSSDVPKFNSNMLDDILGYKLITKSDNGFCDYLDVNDDLSNKICNAINNYTNLETFTMGLKSKDLTYTRIKRALLHILLDIKRNDIYESEKINYIPYIRILGFRKNSDILLHAIKENCKIPIISKMADAENVLDKNGIDFLKNEIRINDIYRILLQNECGKSLKNEFVQPIVII